MQTAFVATMNCTFLQEITRKVRYSILTIKHHQSV
jgi:hypothetical protein